MSIAAHLLPLLPTCSPSFPFSYPASPTCAHLFVILSLMPTFYPPCSPVASHVDEEDANGSVDVVVVLTVQIK
jgi:hypothetical protein